MSHFFCQPCRMYHFYRGAQRQQPLHKFKIGYERQCNLGAGVIFRFDNLGGMQRKGFYIVGLFCGKPEFDDFVFYFE